MSNPKIFVVSSISPDSLSYNEDAQPILPEALQTNDKLDPWNHPRKRRALILTAIKSQLGHVTCFQQPSAPARNLDQYQAICTTPLLDLLSTAWTRWCNLSDGREDFAAIPHNNDHDVPALKIVNVPLHRTRQQRPSKNIMGAIGYFCTDAVTPIFSGMDSELIWDAAVIAQTLELAKLHPKATIYALQIHPGHHAAADSFGGYCYLNHAAFLASQLKQTALKVAILDVDYHCGDGTASIFDNDPNVMVVSLHCHPDYEYPFHIGFEDQTGLAGTIVHLPLLPGTTWKEYGAALQRGLKRIAEFGAAALVVSLGLDTQKGDPVALKRAGFQLDGQDYYNMGKTIGSHVKALDIPTVFVQEGGYHMETVGINVVNVLDGFSFERSSS